VQVFNKFVFFFTERLARFRTALKRCYIGFLSGTENIVVEACHVIVIPVQIKGGLYRGYPCGQCGMDTETQGTIFDPSSYIDVGPASVPAPIFTE
jgi:hypothetical protein